MTIVQVTSYKFLQNFPVVDVSQVAMCISLQISERVTGEENFAKDFAMSSNSQNAIKKKSFRPNGSYKST
jgi:hypothetical protein